MSVTAYISTKDRYYTTLPIAIMSIAMQTVRPDKFILYDDGEQKDLRKEKLYSNLFSVLDDKKIPWEVRFGARCGQVANHQHAVDTCKTEWLWRLDDDNYAEPTALEEMLRCGEDATVGAVGGVVLHPHYNIIKPNFATSQIEGVFNYSNIQWYRHEGRTSVDHLYSTFIYRKNASSHGYCKELSPVGHHEETLFTYEMKRAGWKIMVEPRAITWHLRDDQGGIRAIQYRGKEDMWGHDDMVFKRKLEEYGVDMKLVKLVVLNNGLGDHLAFKSILPEMKKAHPELVLAVCYKEAFKGADVKLISIADAKLMDNIDKYDIYKWMWDKNWKRSIVDAYRVMYSLPVVESSSERKQESEELSMVAGLS